MNKKFIYYGSAAFGGVLLSLYLFITTFINPSWERQAGLIYGYEFRTEGLISECAKKTSHGLIILQLFKDGRYQISIDQDLRKRYLYSEGTWTTQLDDFSKRMTYQLKSNPIDIQFAQYRVHSYPNVGHFYSNSDKKEILPNSSVEGIKEAYERFDFLQFEEYFLEVKRFEKYPILKKLQSTSKNKLKQDQVIVADQTDMDYYKRLGHQKYNDRLLNALDSTLVILSNEELFQQSEFVYKNNNLAFVFNNKRFQLYILRQETRELYSQGIFNTTKGGYLLTSEDISDYEGIYRCFTFGFHGVFYSYQAADFVVKDCMVFPLHKNAYEAWEFNKTADNIVDIHTQKKYTLYQK